MKKLLFFSALLLTLGCSSPSDKVQSTELEVVSQRLEDLLDTRQYQRAAALIDSAHQAGVLPEELAQAERGCMYLMEQKFAQAESYLEKAVADEEIKSKYYKNYLRYANILVLDQMCLHKWEEGLRLAEEVCRETRFSSSVDELLVSYQMYAYIGGCQAHLRQWDEAANIGERVYASCLFLQRTHPVAARATFMVALTMLEAYNDVERWPETELWCRRSLAALEDFKLLRDTPSEYDHWTGYFNSLYSVALQRNGKVKEGKEAYLRFQSTDFSKGLGGLNGIYYLAATNQWHRIESMLPAIDSLIVSFGAKLVPEYLNERYRYPYLTYRYLGRKDQALAIADSVLKHLDTAVQNERMSKAMDLAKLYETREKEMELKEKDAKLGIVWTGAIAVALVLVSASLFLIVVIRRRSELKLQEEHAKLLDAYDQLMDANARAEESSKMKTSFIHQISHEIRTPLNILSGFTQIITTSAIKLDDKTREEAREAIMNNTNRITQLVNKMLELSDITSKSVIERTDLIPIRTVAEQAITDSGIWQLPTVKFSFTVDDDMDKRTTLTHQRSAVRALVLLLDNARKFLVAPDVQPTGSVTLHLSLHKQDGQEQACFAVEDTGIGIPANETERIFDEFVQLNDYYPGTGIGLTVARNLARRIGGDIMLDTDYQPGARFCLLLPLA